MTGTPEDAAADAIAAAQTAYLERRIDSVVDYLRAAYRTGTVSIEFINGMEAAAALIACQRVGLHNCVAGVWRNHDRADDRPEETP
jgi:hypothetical protein